MDRIGLERRRILIDGTPVLLLAGEVHYFRLARADWPARLRQLLDAGADTLATYVPWIWHELPDGTIDLDGRTHPQRDLAGFLDLAADLGLRVIVRPGPFVMAELKNEGLPYRLYPALTPAGWDGEPAPSRTLDYLAPEFLAAADGWYAAVMPVVASRLAGRGGPVVAVQLDNEIGMLSWVTNAPELTASVLADLGPGAAQPVEAESLAVHDRLGRYMRARYARYVEALRASAEKHGVSGVPWLVNVHGTGGGRGRTYPVGLSQLADALRLPGVVAGTDLYLGDLTVGNVADLYVANAFTAAASPGPLTSLEFEAGDGNYSDRLELLYPPESVELKTRLALAQGNRLLNYYLFTGGVNPPLSEPVGDGNDRLAFTGERHGFAAPVSPEGATGPYYAALARVLGAVRAVEPVLADADEEHDDLALGFVPDHYLTEYAHPASAARREQVDELERYRGMGAEDMLARALLLTGYSFGAVDLQDPGSSLPSVLALATPSFLRRDVQSRLVSYVRDGGTLLLYGLLPAVEPDGAPCTVLADALGLTGGAVVSGSAEYFPSAQAPGYPEVRAGFLQRLAGGSPFLTEVGTGSSCGVTVSYGSGRAVVLAAGYPGDLAFWRSLVPFAPRSGLAFSLPGVVTTSTVTPAGERLLHLLNVAPYEVSFTAFGRSVTLPARTGAMLPAFVRVPGGAVVGGTCELAGPLTFRPVAPSGGTIEVTMPVTASRGTVVPSGAGWLVTVDGPDPVTLTLR